MHLPDNAVLSIRTTNRANENHHIWKNGRHYWIAATVHLPGFKKDRVRVSLFTSDIIEARRKRDQLLGLV